MTEQKITKEYLTLYRDIVKQYREICRKAHLNISDYADRPQKQIENIKRKIEKAKKELPKQKEIIINHQNYIREQINKIAKLNHKQILTMRYIYNFEWKKIINESAKYEARFDDEEFIFETLRRKVFDRHRCALKSLEKVQEVGV